MSVVKLEIRCFIAEAIRSADVNVFKPAVTSTVRYTPDYSDGLSPSWASIPSVRI